MTTNFPESLTSCFSIPAISCDNKIFENEALSCSSMVIHKNCNDGEKHKGVRHV